MDLKAGYLILYKESGMTSFSCVNRIRKLSGLKAGHTGTLDPLAEGVLPILLGSATKLSGMIMDGIKEYTAGGILGIRTDTLDVTGKVTEKRLQTEEITEEMMLKVLKEFTGEIMQIPPMYSALKKDGKKLYELARQGIEIEREKRDVTIYSAKLLSFSFPRFTIRVKCSKGTYIRTLVDDIGEKLGTLATMETLVRNTTGGFGEEESVKLSELDSLNIFLNIRPVEDLFKEYDKIVVDEKTERLFLNGVKIQDRSITTLFPAGKMFRIYSKKNEFIGTASNKKGSVIMEYRV